MRPVAIFAAVLLVSALASPEARQDPQQPRPVFRAGVDAVQLEVSVLDEDRRPVHELTAQDFTVLEDGKPQQIIRVDETVLAEDDWPEPVWSRAARSDIESNSIEDQRLIAIIMDDARCCNVPNLARGSIASDRWAITNAVKTALQLIDGLGSHDRAAVILTHDPVQIGRFTNDREALRESVRRFQPITEAGCVDLFRQMPEPLLANLMAAAPAKLKAIVTIGSTVPLNARDLPRCPTPTYGIADSGITVAGRVPPVVGREQEDPTASPIPRYFLNVSGLVIDRLGRTAANRQGPNGTGGLNIVNTNDLTAAVADIFDANDSYYVVGFRTTRPTVDCKLRRIEVKVNRPGNLDVRSRHMYQRPCPEPTSGKPKPPKEIVPFSPIVAGLLPSFDITLQATATPFAMPGRPGAALAITVDVSHPMPETRRPTVEDLDLRMVAYESGDTRHDEHTRVQLTFGPDAPSRVATVMHSRLSVEPGHYELWLTVRDPQTNRIGSVFYNVEVPDFAHRTLSLSGIVLGADPAPGFSAPAAFADLLPIVPGVSRELGRQEDVAAFFRIYQGGEAPLVPVTLLVKIVTGQGAIAVEHRDVLAADRFGALRAADYRWRMQLADLSPGPHLLSVEARVGGHIAQARDVPFIVR